MKKEKTKTTMVRVVCFDVKETCRVIADEYFKSEGKANAYLKTKIKGSVKDNAMPDKEYQELMWSKLYIHFYK